MTKTIKKVLRGEMYFRRKNPFVLWSGNEIKHVINPNLYIEVGFLNRDGSIDLWGYFREQQKADDPADWYTGNYSIYFGKKSYTGYITIHIPTWSAEGRIKAIEDDLKAKWNEATFEFSYPNELYKITLKNISKEVQP
jgi:hypothetical protein